LTWLKFPLVRRTEQGTIGAPLRSVIKLHEA
jgi:hypothetical protein